MKPELVIENRDPSRPVELAERSRCNPVQRGYRLIAPLYDTIFGMALWHGRRLAVTALDLDPGERVLEVGVGSGLSLGMYPRLVSVVGIDISNEMLERARQRCELKRPALVAGLLQMDVQNMAFADNRFDKAVLMYTLSGFDDPLAALVEIGRVCKPGALLVIVNRFQSKSVWSRLTDRVLMPLYRLMRYRIDIDADAIVEQAGLELLERKPANLFGYSTVLVCRLPKDSLRPLPVASTSMTSDVTGSEFATA